MTRPPNKSLMSRSQRLAQIIWEELERDGWGDDLDLNWFHGIFDPDWGMGSDEEEEHRDALAYVLERVARRFMDEVKA